MALSSILDKVMAHGKGYVELSGSFRPNGTSAVDNDLNTGTGFSVTRFDVGEFRITLEETWPELVCATFQVQVSSVTDSSIEITNTVDVTSSPATIDIIHLAAGVGADIADGAGNRIHFRLTLRQTDVKK